VLLLAVLFLFLECIAVAGAAAASQVGGFREYEVAQVPGGLYISVRAIAAGGMDRILRDSENEAARRWVVSRIVRRWKKRRETHLNKSSSATRCFDLRRSCEYVELATLLRDIVW
jgi:hypothetical protein